MWRVRTIEGIKGGCKKKEKFERRQRKGTPSEGKKERRRLYLPGRKKDRG